ENCAQALFILVVPARNDRNIGGAPDFTPKSFSPGVGLHQFNLCIWKALARDEIRAVIYQGSTIARVVRQTRQTCAYMSRATDNKARLRLYALEHHQSIAPHLGFRRKLFHLDSSCF